MNPFRGTFTALITPFRDGRVDYPALEKHVSRQIESGVDGLVPCGTTGESPTLSAEEHRGVIECVVRVAAGRVPVVAGAGSNNTSRAIQLAQEARDCGASGLLVVSPYYNKPTQKGLYEHFGAVARAVDLPVVLYNIPGRCGVEIAIATIARLHDELDNIVAVKHATGRVDDAAELLQVSEIAVLSGDDPITWPLMSLGSVGVISVLSNLAPRSVKRLTQAVLQGQFPAALAAHRHLYPLAKGLLSLETNPIPIKTALAMRGWCAEEFRLPMCPLSPENRTKLQELLARHPLD